MGEVVEMAQSSKVKAQGNSGGEMPRLNEGKHPAQKIVYRYKSEAIEAILEVHRRISLPPLSGELFDELALAGEMMVERIRRYRRAELAGGKL